MPANQEPLPVAPFQVVPTGVRLGSTTIQADADSLPVEAVAIAFETPVGTLAFVLTTAAAAQLGKGLSRLAGPTLDIAPGADLEAEARRALADPKHRG